MMKRDEIARAIYVMGKYLDGERIQGCRIGDCIWCDEQIPGWDWSKYTYRVKPKVKRFGNMWEFMNALTECSKQANVLALKGKEHEDLHKVTALCFDDEYVELDGMDKYSLAEISEMFTFINGKPCAVIEP